jgi:hypothetical protein
MILNQLHDFAGKALAKGPRATWMIAVLSIEQS